MSIVSKIFLFFLFLNLILSCYSQIPFEKIDSSRVIHEKKGEINNNGEKEGTWYYYYNLDKDSALHQYGNFKNGKKDGIWISFYENKIISSESFYKNGIIFSSAYYYENGYKEREVLFDNLGNKQTEIVYSEKGGIECLNNYKKLNKNNIPYSKCFNKGSLVFEGFFDDKDTISPHIKYYYKMGKIKVIHFYSASRLTKRIDYYYNGNIKLITKYLNWDNYEVLMYSYYKNGNIRSQTGYIGKQRHGKILFYDKKGNLTDTAYYNNGKLVL